MLPLKTVTWRGGNVNIPLNLCFYVYIYFIINLLNKASQVFWVNKNAPVNSLSDIWIQCLIVSYPIKSGGRVMHFKLSDFQYTRNPIRYYI